MDADVWIHISTQEKKENYNMDVAYWDKEKLPSGNLSDLA